LKDHINIWQQNVNKLPTCQHDLLSSDKLMSMNIDIVAIQEPAMINKNHLIASKEWISVYPTMHATNPEKTRLLTLIRAQISTDSWNQLDFLSSNVTVVQLSGAWGKLTIFNIYNEGECNNTINLLTKYHQDNHPSLENSRVGTAHQIWLGDFNRHHPYWDDLRDSRLFTNTAIVAAESLIEAVADAGLDMALPGGIPTHCHSVTKHWSRLDHIFITEASTSAVIACNVLTNHRGINTNHVPILTELNLGIAISKVKPTPNFRDVDWEEFRKTLANHLGPDQLEEQITSQRQLDERCSSLTKAIQNMIRDQVPILEITPKSKRWWTKELTQMCKSANKLGRQSFLCRNKPEHAVHNQHKEAKKRYEGNLEYNRKHHWRDWLEKADEPDIWMANCYVTVPATDGSKDRIPVLKVTVDGQETSVQTNSEKGNALAKGFFPLKPAISTVPPNAEYPPQCQANIRITVDQL